MLNLSRKTRIVGMDISLSLPHKQSSSIPCRICQEFDTCLARQATHMDVPTFVTWVTFGNNILLASTVTVAMTYAKDTPGLKTAYQGQGTKSWTHKKIMLHGQGFEPWTHKNRSCARSGVQTLDRLTRLFVELCT